MSPLASRYFFKTSPMTAREDLTFEIARRPWSYSFWASTMTRTLSEGVGLEGGTPRKERKDLPDCGVAIFTYAIAIVCVWKNI